MTSWSRSPFVLGLLAGLGALAGWAVLKALASVADVLLLVVLALFFAISLEPLVEWMVGLGLRRGLGGTGGALGPGAPRGGLGGPLGAAGGTRGPAAGRAGPRRATQMRH